MRRKQVLVRPRSHAPAWERTGATLRVAADRLLVDGLPGRRRQPGRLFYECRPERPTYTGRGASGKCVPTRERGNEGRRGVWERGDSVGDPRRAACPDRAGRQSDAAQPQRAARRTRYGRRPGRRGTPPGGRRNATRTTHRRSNGRRPPAGRRRLLHHPAARPRAGVDGA